MSTFTFFKGAADVVAGSILLVKPEVIYHSFIARKLSQLSGLRTANPFPDRDGRSAGTALNLLVIVVGLAHMKASRDRKALPPILQMNLLWASFTLGTVIFARDRATSTLLLTAINHFVFFGIMKWRTGIRMEEIVW